MILGKLGLLAIAITTLGFIVKELESIAALGAFVAIPCIIVGLPLSAIGLYQGKKRGQGTGMAIAGTGANVVGLIIIVLWLAVIGPTAST